MPRKYVSRGLLTSRPQGGGTKKSGLSPTIGRPPVCMRMIQYRGCDVLSKPTPSVSVVPGFTTFQTDGKDIVSLLISPNGQYLGALYRVVKTDYFRLFNTDGTLLIDEINASIVSVNDDTIIYNQNGFINIYNLATQQTTTLEFMFTGDYAWYKTIIKTEYEVVEATEYNVIINGVNVDAVDPLFTTTILSDSNSPPQKFTYRNYLCIINSLGNFSYSCLVYDTLTNTSTTVPINIVFPFSVFDGFSEVGGELFGLNGSLSFVSVYVGEEFMLNATWTFNDNVRVPYNFIYKQNNIQVEIPLLNSPVVFFPDGTRWCGLRTINSVKAPVLYTINGVLIRDTFQSVPYDMNSLCVSEDGLTLYGSAGLQPIVVWNVDGTRS